MRALIEILEYRFSCTSVVRLFFSAAFGGSGEIGIVICVFFYRFVLGFVSFLFIALRSVGPREHVAQN